jgi:hypothetical protein
VVYVILPFRNSPPIRSGGGLRLSGSDVRARMTQQPTREPGEPNYEDLPLDALYELRDLRQSENDLLDAYRHSNALFEDSLQWSVALTGLLADGGTDFDPPTLRADRDRRLGEVQRLEDETERALEAYAGAMKRRMAFERVAWASRGPPGLLPRGGEPLPEETEEDLEDALDVLKNKLLLKKRKLARIGSGEDLLPIAEKGSLSKDVEALEKEIEETALRAERLRDRSSVRSGGPLEPERTALPPRGEVAAVPVSGRHRSSGTCASCGKPAGYLCTSCREFHYCSIACQTKHQFEKGYFCPNAIHFGLI